MTYPGNTLTYSFEDTLSKKIIAWCFSLYSTVNASYSCFYSFIFSCNRIYLYLLSNNKYNTHHIHNYRAWKHYPRLTFGWSSKSSRYGVCLQHPLVQGVKREVRGRDTDWKLETQSGCPTPLSALKHLLISAEV